MKKRIIQLAALTLTALMGAAQAATVTVTVADDGVSNIGAAGTFYWALTNAQAGDTIAFAIPGLGRIICKFRRAVSRSFIARVT